MTKENDIKKIITAQLSELRLSHESEIKEKDEIIESLKNQMVEIKQNYEEKIEEIIPKITIKVSNYFCLFI